MVPSDFRFFVISKFLQIRLKRVWLSKCHSILNPADYKAPVSGMIIYKKIGPGCIYLLKIKNILTLLKGYHFP